MVLFLDFASGAQSIALVAADRTIACMPLPDRTDESALLPAIEGLLAGQGKTFQDLSRIAAVTGPGGFMSLRVGISLANALSFALGIPLAGVHLSEVWGARLFPHPASRSARGTPLQAHDPGEGKGVRTLWLHSTKREALFVRGYGEYEAQWPEPTLVSLSALSTFHFPHSTWYVGELIDSQRAALPALKPLQDLHPLEDILPGLITRLSYERRQLEPWYGRGA
jgi:tRNA threonylcarbamoyl adenosine modification protein YeaZ